MDWDGYDNAGFIGGSDEYYGNYWAGQALERESYTELHTNPPRLDIRDDRKSNYDRIRNAKCDECMKKWYCSMPTFPVEMASRRRNKKAALGVFVVKGPITPDAPREWWREYFSSMAGRIDAEKIRAIVEAPCEKWVDRWRPERQYGIVLLTAITVVGAWAITDKPTITKGDLFDFYRNGIGGHLEDREFFNAVDEITHRLLCWDWVATNIKYSTDEIHLINVFVKIHNANYDIFHK